MSLTNRIRTVYYDDAGQVSDYVLSYEGSGAFKVDEQIPDAMTTEVVVAIDKSALKSVVLLATKNLTLYTNADTPSQDDTIALVANVPKLWSADIGGANPFDGADVTSIFVVNASGAEARLRIAGITDATP